MSSEKKQLLDYEDNIAGRGGNSDYCVDEKKENSQWASYIRHHFVAIVVSHWQWEAIEAM